MSNAYWNKGGLRFWSEEELSRRDSLVSEARQVISSALSKINGAWNVVRVEGPMLMPSSEVNPEYLDGDDLWKLEKPVGEDLAVLRPETTPSSYACIQALNHGGYKFPLCVWQVGKSFRRESSDGASASRMRYNEFTQLEFQCIYANSTKADYAEVIIPVIQKLLTRHCGVETRIVESDRLPSYSLKTMDIEAKVGRRWIEMCSISIRTDFSDSHTVLEIAIGADRVIECAGKKK